MKNVVFNKIMVLIYPLRLLKMGFDPGGYKKYSDLIYYFSSILLGSQAVIPILKIIATHESSVGLISCVGSQYLKL